MDKKSPKWTYLLLFGFILLSGALGGYFRYMFFQHHLQAKGFVFVGAARYPNSKQKVFLFRHKETQQPFVLIPQGEWQGRKIPSFLISLKPLSSQKKSWKKAKETLHRLHLRLPKEEELQYILFLRKKGFYFGLSPLSKEWVRERGAFCWKTGKKEVSDQLLPFRGVYYPKKRTGISLPK